MDDNSIQECYVEHYPYLLKWAKHYLRLDQDAAEDAVANLWAHVIVPSRWNSWNGKSSRRTWLLTCMRNLHFMNRGRGRKWMQGTSHNPYPLNTFEGAYDITAPDEIEQLHTMMDFDRVPLDRLTEKERDAVMRWANGEPHETNTMKIRKLRAVRHLRQYMDMDRRAASTSRMIARVNAVRSA